MVVVKHKTNTLEKKVSQLNASISNRLTFLIDNYEIFVRSNEKIPKEVCKANDSLDRLLTKRLMLIKRIVREELTIDNFSDYLLTLADFPQEIKYLMFRLKELLDDRKSFRRYEAYLTKQELKERVSIENKRDKISTAISTLPESELNEILKMLGEW